MTSEFPFKHIHNLYLIPTYYCNVDPERDLILIPEVIAVGTHKGKKGLKISFQRDPEKLDAIIYGPPAKTNQYWGPPIGTEGCDPLAKIRKYAQECYQPAKAIFSISQGNGAWIDQSLTDASDSHDPESAFFLQWINNMDNWWARQVLLLHHTSRPDEVNQFIDSERKQGAINAYKVFEVTAKMNPDTKKWLESLGSSRTYDNLPEENRQEIEQEIVNKMLQTKMTHMGFEFEEKSANENGSIEKAFAKSPNANTNISFRCSKYVQIIRGEVTNFQLGITHKIRPLDICDIRGNNIPNHNLPRLGFRDVLAMKFELNTGYHFGQKTPWGWQGALKGFIIISLRNDEQTASTALMLQSINEQHPLPPALVAARLYQYEAKPQRLQLPAPAPATLTDEEMLMADQMREVDGRQQLMIESGMNANP